MGDWEVIDGETLNNLRQVDDDWNVLDYDSLDTLKRTINSSQFKQFANLAYANPWGVLIRTNPDTGKKEMFVAGSRTTKDWQDNFNDYYGSYNDYRMARQEQLAETAVLENVKVVYGHSRGGAMVADMRLPLTIQKVGLDAAMVLASNKNMLNLTEAGTGAWGSTFDQTIGRTGRFNVPVDYSPRYPHKVWKV